MRSSNPALRASTFEVGAPAGSATMTIEGVVIRTAVLLLLVIVPFVWVWSNYPPVHVPTGRLQDIALPAGLGGVVMFSAIAGFVLVLIVSFKKQTAPFLSPLYAILEGVVLGSVSAAFEGVFPGIAVQAGGATFGTLAALLFAYMTRVIKPTENFKLGVAAATGGIFLLYLGTWVCRLFGIEVPFVHQSGVWGIVFSAFVVCIAALNLVLDFDFIEQGAARGAPKYLEWYAAFGLLVTLVWLYIEFLRLIAKARSRK